MNCRYCSGLCIKAGLRSNIQKYKCKTCGKYQQQRYRQSARQLSLNKAIVLLLKEGCGNRSICRIPGIAMNTLLCRIKAIADRTASSHSFSVNSDYEVDELRTIVGSKRKETWIIYAIERRSRRVVSFIVGARTKTNLSFLIHRILCLKPRKVFTDGLNIYPALIPVPIHQLRPYMTNRIERLNLTLRTHLKRLSRRTICFSRSQDMLEACLQIYFWS